MISIYSIMATEAQRRARQAWKKRNPEKHNAINLRCYYKKKWSMTREEALILGDVRYLFKEK